MIMHIVLLQMKSETTPAQITTALQHVQALEHQIPGIVRIVTGKNLSGQHKSYTYGFLMQFVSEEAFKGYAAHPSYEPVRLELQNICQGNIVLDLQPPPSPLEDLVHSVKSSLQALMRGWQGNRS